MSPYVLIGYPSSILQEAGGSAPGFEGTMASPVVSTVQKEKTSDGLVEAEDDEDDEDVVSKKSDVKL